LRFASEDVPAGQPNLILGYERNIFKQQREVGRRELLRCLGQLGTIDEAIDKCIYHVFSDGSLATQDAHGRYSGRLAP
jgi:hypothetical protein